MLLQVDYLEFTILTPLIEMVIIAFLLLLMLYIYFKKENPLFVTIIFSFSLIIGFMSMSNFILPFSPYIQIFFIVIQAVIFSLTMLDYAREYKLNKEND